MKLRLFTHDARWVWRRQIHSEPGRLLQDMLVLHRQAVDWNGIFRESLKMMALNSVADNSGLRLENGAGEVSWQRHPCGTKISLRLERFSPQKQTLVAAALAKAARYYQPEEKICPK